MSSVQECAKIMMEKEKSKVPKTLRRLLIVEYSKNKGKGGAVKTGVKVATGQYVLMLDSDGATRIHEFQKVFEKAKSIEKNGRTFVAGSRRHLMEGVLAQRTFFRKLMSGVAHILIYKICGVKVMVHFSIETQLKTTKKYLNGRTLNAGSSCSRIKAPLSYLSLSMC